MASKNEKLKKSILGKVVSVLMNAVAVVEIERTKSHRLYGKRYKVSKRVKARIGSQKVETSDLVYISEIRPASKETHFEITKVEAK